MLSCGGNDEPSQAAIEEQIIKTHIESDSITAIRHDSGVYYEIITENPTGNIQQTSGSILSIYYHARILGGATIEQISLAAPDAPAKMKQGVGAIYPVGLDTVLPLMKEGETFKFFIPSELAYGDFSLSTLIPPHSIIEIEVELVLIQDEAALFIEEVALINNYITTNDLNNLVDNPLDSVKQIVSGEFYKRTRDDDPGNVALPNGLITINYTASFLDGNEFDAGTLEYLFNTGVVIQGLDNGIAQMERGEHALIFIPSSNAYKESAMYIPTSLGAEFVTDEIIPLYATKVSPFQVLIFDVSLL